LNIRAQTLNRLERLITTKIINALDVIISNKHVMLPNMLSINNIGNQNEILISNLAQLIDI